jgi:hypothetical protein
MAGFISGNATLSDGSVATAALADNAVTLAKMAGGTDGNLIGIDASGDPAYIATGSDGQVLTSGGAGVAALMEAASGGGATVGTRVATTSGDDITILSGIPAGTSLIYIGWDGVGQTSTDHLNIVLGDSGGFETTGYSAGGTRGTTNTSVGAITSGFGVRSIQSNGFTWGLMTLVLMHAATYQWVANWITWEDNANIMVGSGEKELSAELTQIRLSSSASATFDGGNISGTYI